MSDKVPAACRGCGVDLNHTPGGFEHEANCLALRLDQSEQERQRLFTLADERAKLHSAEITRGILLERRLGHCEKQRDESFERFTNMVTALTAEIVNRQGRLDRIATLARDGRETSQFTHARAALDEIIKHSCRREAEPTPAPLPDGLSPENGELSDPSAGVDGAVRESPQHSALFVERHRP